MTPGPATTSAPESVAHRGREPATCTWPWAPTIARDVLRMSLKPWAQSRATAPRQGAIRHRKGPSPQISLHISCDVSLHSCMPNVGLAPFCRLIEEIRALRPVFLTPTLGGGMTRLRATLVI